MGEAKRRKDTLKEKYGQEDRLFPWLPISKNRAEQISKWNSRITWTGIFLLAATWVTIGFIGPAFGLWQVH